MNKISIIAGMSLHTTGEALAALSQPIILQEVFYRSAWKQYAEDISMDLGDPSLIQRIEDREFRRNMYEAIRKDRDSFDFTYATYTIDDSECSNMPITFYKGTFNLKSPAHNVHAVALKEISINVETLQRAECAPKL